MKNKPERPLVPGTKIVTNDKLHDVTGFPINSKHQCARRPGFPGVIRSHIPGYNDIYWVEHVGDSVIAVYRFTEFELDEP